MVKLPNYIGLQVSYLVNYSSVVLILIRNSLVSVPCFNQWPVPFRAEGRNDSQTCGWRSDLSLMKFLLFNCWCWSQQPWPREQWVASTCCLMNSQFVCVRCRSWTQSSTKCYDRLIHPIVFLFSPQHEKSSRRRTGRPTATSTRQDAWVWGLNEFLYFFRDLNQVVISLDSTLVQLPEIVACSSVGYAVCILLTNWFNWLKCTESLGNYRATHNRPLGCGGKG